MIIHIVESTATGTLAMLRLAANSQIESGPVKVIYSRRPETPENLAALFDSRVELINVQMGSLSEKASATLSIRKIVKDSAPKAVFLHSSFAGFIGRMALLFDKTPVFYLPHCISFMRKDISGAKALAFKLLEWVGSIKSATYVACSHSEGDEIKKSVPFRKCVVVENAVNTESWNSHEWLSKENVVVTVGQIRLQKDPQRFADIAKQVLANNTDVRFVWVGDGDEDAKQALKDAGVDVVGWKTPDEVKNYLSGSRYYLSTALWEGMPVSPIEAMLSGCVAILSDCAGNVDIIKDKSTGFLFSEVSEAVTRIEEILSGKYDLKEISGRGTEHCAENYNIGRYVSDIGALVKG